MRCPACGIGTIRAQKPNDGGFICDECGFNDGHAKEARDYAYLISKLMEELEDHPSLIADGLYEEFKAAHSNMIKIYQLSGQWRSEENNPKENTKCQQ